MSGESAPFPWSDAAKYEPYFGRWSRRVAREFVPWLDIPAHSRWLEVGCGTGALTAEIVAQAAPSAVEASDPSEPYLAHARSVVPDPFVTFSVGRAERLASEDSSVDAVVSGLVLNFADDPVTALREARRVARPGGVVAAYIWDYSGEMWAARYFWDTAILLDPVARRRHEGRRFAAWIPDELVRRFEAAGLVDVSVHPIVIDTVFRDFDDYWGPLLSNQGSGASYVATLQPDSVGALREAVKSTLPIASNGSIPLTARAWGVKGTVPLQATTASASAAG